MAKPTKRKKSGKSPGKSKKRTKQQKEVNALRSKVYRARKKLKAGIDSESERKKQYNKILRLNAELGAKKSQYGIKSRKSPVQAKAAKRSGNTKGFIIQTFDFSEVKDAKKRFTEYFNNGSFNSFNGRSTKNILNAISELDNLILSMDSYKNLVLALNPQTGKLNAWVIDASEEEEEEE